MVLKLYFDLMSQPARAVWIFMKINKIPFEEKPIALRKGEHYSDEYKKINPFSLVPVINDDGFVLTETVAILKYLSLKYNVPEHWYPRDNIQRQARIDEYMNWQHWNTRMNGSMVFQHLVIIPRAMGDSINTNQVDKFKGMMETTVERIASYYLKDQPYLCGQEVSLADLLGVCELMQLYACCEEKLYESNPVVKAWVDRVITELGPMFKEGSKVVYRTREMFSKKKQSARL